MSLAWPLSAHLLNFLRVASVMALFHRVSYNNDFRGVSRGHQEHYMGSLMKSSDCVIVFSDERTDRPVALDLSVRHPFEAVLHSLRGRRPTDRRAMVTGRSDMGMQSA